jgi:hypothetical protein
VAPEGAILIGGLVILFTGIAVFAIIAHARGRRAREALRAATQREAAEVREFAAELEETECRLRDAAAEQIAQERASS